MIEAFDALCFIVYMLSMAMMCIITIIGFFTKEKVSDE